MAACALLQEQKCTLDKSVLGTLLRQNGSRNRSDGSRSLRASHVLDGEPHFISTPTGMYNHYNIMLDVARLSASISIARAAQVQGQPGPASPLAPAASDADAGIGAPTAAVQLQPAPPPLPPPPQLPLLALPVVSQQPAVQPAVQPVVLQQHTNASEPGTSGASAPTPSFVMARATSAAITAGMAQQLLPHLHAQAAAARVHVVSSPTGRPCEDMLQHLHSCSELGLDLETSGSGGQIVLLQVCHAVI